MTTASGRVGVADQALAVPVEPVSRLAPSGFDPSRGVVSKLLHPTTGILRGIFGDETLAGKGGPDQDAKLLKITVGELREIDRALRLQRAIINDLRIDLAIATEAGTAETPQSGSVHEGAGRQASPKSPRRPA